jgi:hypothetical protein
VRLRLVESLGHRRLEIRERVDKMREACVADMRRKERAKAERTEAQNQS